MDKALLTFLVVLFATLCKEKREKLLNFSPLFSYNMLTFSFAIAPGHLSDKCSLKRLSNSGVQKRVEMIIRLPMSPRAIGKNLTHEGENNSLHVENNNKRPSILREKTPENEIVTKRNIRSEKWSRSHLCGLPLMRFLNSRLTLFSSGSFFNQMWTFSLTIRF